MKDWNKYCQLYKKEHGFETFSRESGDCVDLSDLSDFKWYTYPRDPSYPSYPSKAPNTDPLADHYFNYKKGLKNTIQLYIDGQHKAFHITLVFAIEPPVLHIYEFSGACKISKSLPFFSSNDIRYCRRISWQDQRRSDLYDRCEVQHTLGKDEIPLSEFLRQQAEKLPQDLEMRNTIINFLTESNYEKTPNIVYRPKSLLDNNLQQPPLPSDCHVVDELYDNSSSCCIIS